MTTIATHRAPALQATPELLAAIADLRHARAAVKAAEAAEAKANGVVLAELAGEDRAFYGDVAVVSVTVRTRAGVNRDLLRDAFPEAYEATRTVTEYGVITIL